MYKFTLVIFSLFLSVPSLIAQQNHVAKFSNPTQQKRVEVYLTNAKLSIEGSNDKTVTLKATGQEPLPERAKGLRPISRTATDNTGLGLEVLESDNSMTIRQTANSELTLSLRLPNDVHLMLDHSGRNKEAITINNIRGEMELDVSGSDLKINGVTGPIVANNTRGNIEVKFTQVSQEGPTSINTVSGFVDVTMPSNTKATLELTTLSDEVFTDFDLQRISNEDNADSNEKRKRRNRDCSCDEQNIKGTINGGGVEIFLKSVRDNIYLRKG